MSKDKKAIINVQCKVITIEFDGFRFQAGLNSFHLTLKKWIEATQTARQWLTPVGSDGWQGCAR